MNRRLTNRRRQRPRRRRRQPAKLRWWRHPIVELFIAVTGLVGGFFVVAQIVDVFRDRATGAKPGRPTFDGVTQFELFDPAKADAVQMGTTFPVTCGPSKVILSDGAYLCVVSTDDTPGIMLADPCFGAPTQSVLCVMYSGTVQRYDSVHFSHPFTAYKPKAAALSTMRPWRLELSDGAVCLWDWFSDIDRGAVEEDLWACSATIHSSVSKTGGALLIPDYPDGLFEPPNGDLLAFENAFIINWTKRYVIDLELDQSETWRALTGIGDGKYEYVNVRRAWY